MVSVPMAPSGLHPSELPEDSLRAHLRAASELPQRSLSALLRAPSGLPQSTAKAPSKLPQCSPVSSRRRARSELGPEWMLAVHCRLLAVDYW